jgi:hypothetical protein
MSFKEYLNENDKWKKDAVLVAPLTGHVKGSNVEKNVKASSEFFGKKGGAVVAKLEQRGKPTKVVLIYTTSSTGKDSLQMLLSHGQKRGMEKVTLMNNRSDRALGQFEPFAYLEFDKEGNITKTGGIKQNTVTGTDKINTAYALK